MFSRISVPFSCVHSSFSRFRHRLFCIAILPCTLAGTSIVSDSQLAKGDTITSTVIANAGNDTTKVEDSQTNTFFPLAAMTTRVGTSGTVTHSSVSASFTSEDLFQVNVNNDWDASGAPTGGTMGFGEHFEYEFVAEGTQVMVTTSNFIEQPLFAGGSTFGANSFLWRIFDLTIPNGFVVINFSGNGTQSLPLTVGHDYLLRLSDQSSVAGGTFGLGLLHSATFDVSVPANFNAVPEPSTISLLSFFSIYLLASRRRS